MDFPMPDVKILPCLVCGKESSPNQAQCPYSALAPRQFKSQTAATLPSDSGDTFGVARHAPLANMTRSLPATTQPAVLVPVRCRTVALRHHKVATIHLFTHHYVYVQHCSCIHQRHQHQQHSCRSDVRQPAPWHCHGRICQRLWCV